MFERPEMTRTPTAKKTARKTIQHYVFGYGSLICSESRARTANALGGKNSHNSDDTNTGSTGGGIPVRLNNWARLWNVRGPNTYLGVEKCVPDHQWSCVGVLVPLPSSNSDDDKAVLEALDKRELAYQRQRVDLESIERVDELLVREDCENKYYTGTFLGKNQNQQLLPKNNDDEKSPVASEETDANGDDDDDDDDAVCVWIYVPLEKYTGMAQPQNPILQSYVDVCIKGCLSISQAFAKEFVRGTYGWYPGHTHNSSTTSISAAAAAVSDRASDSSKPSCWLDDREHPVYIRADREYSLRHSESLDAVFDTSLLSRRRQWQQNTI